MTRSIFMLIALVAYAVFLATFLYLIGFLASLPAMPTSVDRGIATDWITAGVIDVLLIGIFSVQHSGMARRGFKAFWTRVVPEPVERSVYVLTASLALILLMAFWHPLPYTIWTIDSPLLAGVIWAIFAAGWAIVLLSTFLINHFELFGLAQVVRNFRGHTPAAPLLRRPLFYRLVRHPLYSGFILAFWATPHMSLGHLLLSAGMTVYILIAIGYEERDLVDLFGPDYQQYRREVGKIWPRFGRAG